VRQDQSCWLAPCFVFFVFFLFFFLFFSPFFVCSARCRALAPLFVGAENAWGGTAAKLKGQRARERGGGGKQREKKNKKQKKQH
jgi:hypothetical protein